MGANEAPVWDLRSGVGETEAQGGVKLGAMRHRAEFGGTGGGGVLINPKGR